MTGSVALGVLSVVVAGIAAQWLAWRLRLPAIVLLLAVGLLLGPGLQVLSPTQAFGPMLRPLVGLGVAIIVFEGGLALDFRELRASGEGVLRLTALALPVSLLLSTLAAHALGGMGWSIAFLFGAITVVTGPTVVLPLLRYTRLQRRTASFLKWEAIVNDPVGALLASLALSVIIAHGSAANGELWLRVLAGVGVSIALGVAAGFLVRWLFTHDQAPEVLKAPILLALALGLYALCNVVLDEAGLAASTLFGVTLANLRIPGLAELARFKQGLVVLLVSALFIILSASLDRVVLARISVMILLLTLAMLLVVRPLAIALATWGSSLSWRERALAGWIAPRGIVAAAVAGFASTQLSAAGIPGSQVLMPAVFALIAATMVLHGLSLAPLARCLGLSLGDAPTLAIVGASAWTIDLARALSEGGVSTLLVDTFPGALDPARKRELPVLQAELLSEHGTDQLADHRVDYLLAATPDDIYNSLVSTRLAPEIGRHRVMQLTPPGEVDDWAGLSREWRGQWIGQPPLSFAQLRERWKHGWRFTLLPASDQAASPAKAGAESSDLGDPEALRRVTVLAVRPNGTLAFASPEGAPLTLGAQDRALIFEAPEQI